jgi:hypothetical protein
MLRRCKGAGNGPPFFGSLASLLSTQGRCPTGHAHYYRQYPDIARRAFAPIAGGPTPPPPQQASLPEPRAQRRTACEADGGYFPPRVPTVPASPTRSHGETLRTETQQKGKETSGFDQDACAFKSVKATWRPRGVCWHCGRVSSTAAVPAVRRAQRVAREEAAAAPRAGRLRPFWRNSAHGAYPVGPARTARATGHRRRCSAG